MKQLQIGMAGLDTSHVIGLTECFNDSRLGFLARNARIVKAYPGGSRTFSLSRDRVSGFSAELRDRYGVELVDSLHELEGLDAYLLESVDGSQHLEQFRTLAEFGRPVFIDKPLACSYGDAKRIFELAQEKRIPVMTASCIRYAAGVGDVRPPGTPVVAVDAFGPLSLLPDYRDYFWYGIHTVEILYRYLGCGCEQVRTISHGPVELVIGFWRDGRVGQISGNSAGSGNFGVRLVTEKGHIVSVQNPEIPCLHPMASVILKFFRTGVSPVDPAESLEIIAFLEAASRSRAAGGAPVELRSL